MINKPSTTTKVVDDTVNFSARAPLWTWTTVADGHNTQGGKASEAETSTSQKAQFLATLHASGAPAWGDPIGL